MCTCVSSTDQKRWNCRLFRYLRGREGALVLGRVRAPVPTFQNLCPEPAPERRRVRLSHTSQICPFILTVSLLAGVQSCNQILWGSNASTASALRRGLAPHLHKDAAWVGVGEGAQSSSRLHLWATLGLKSSGLHGDGLQGTSLTRTSYHLGLRGCAGVLGARTRGRGLCREGLGQGLTSLRRTASPDRAGSPRCGR